jgi:AraC-like DNA-binding protein
MAPVPKLSDADVSEVVRLRLRLHWSYRKIADRFGMSESRVQQIYTVAMRDIDVVSAERRVHMQDCAARLAEIPDDTRNLTARICGDPLPGRSALARRAA